MVRVLLCYFCTEGEHKMSAITPETTKKLAAIQPGSPADWRLIAKCRWEQMSRSAVLRNWPGLLRGYSFKIRPTK